tara:strand:- start:1255 stop:1554 length:300 start_codon:yes stop_codon:yes gene_type:complete
MADKTWQEDFGKMIDSYYSPYIKTASYDPENVQTSCSYSAQIRQDTAGLRYCEVVGVWEIAQPGVIYIYSELDPTAIPRRHREACPVLIDPDSYRVEEW